MNQENIPPIFSPKMYLPQEIPLNEKGEPMTQLQFIVHVRRYNPHTLFNVINKNGHSYFLVLVIVCTVGLGLSCKVCVYNRLPSCHLQYRSTEIEFFRDSKNMIYQLYNLI